MYFIPFYVTIKSKTKGWRRKDIEGNPIPYKVLAIDMEEIQYQPEDITESKEYMENRNMGLIDDEDEDEFLKRQENKIPVQSVILQILVGNHLNGNIAWFDINNISYFEA